MKILIVVTAVVCAAVFIICAAGPIPAITEDAADMKAATRAPVAGKSPDEAIAAGQAPKPDPVKEMTPSQLAERISGIIDRFDEIPNFLPGLGRQQGSDGKQGYTYEGVRLDQLGKDALTDLYRKVTRERTRISTERLNRQLVQIRQANQAAEIARQAATRTQAVVAPIVPQVFEPPRQPPATQVPRTPPPQPPPSTRR